jgi:hypothetical protein
MSQGYRTRVVIGSRYTGDFGSQLRAARALPPHARLSRSRPPSRLARAIAFVRFAVRRAAAVGDGDQP